MNTLPEKMNQPGVWVGEYCIRPFDDDQYVLENKDGESLVAEKDELEKVLADLFSRYF